MFLLFVHFGLILYDNCFQMIYEVFESFIEISISIFSLIIERVEKFSEFVIGGNGICFEVFVLGAGGAGTSMVDVVFTMFVVLEKDVVLLLELF